MAHSEDNLVMHGGGTGTRTSAALRAGALLCNPKGRKRTISELAWNGPQDSVHFKKQRIKYASFVQERKGISNTDMHQCRYMKICVCIHLNT